MIADSSDYIINYYQKKRIHLQGVAHILKFVIKSMEYAWCLVQSVFLCKKKKKRSDFHTFLQTVCL